MGEMGEAREGEMESKKKSPQTQILFMSLVHWRIQEFSLGEANLHLPSLPSLPTLLLPALPLPTLPFPCLLLKC
jgi:hypothetical protein